MKWAVTLPARAWVGRVWLGLALAVPCALAWTASWGDAWADNDGADPFAQAQAALKAKRWDEAEALFRDLVREPLKKVPATIGLHEALWGAGLRGNALGVLRSLGPIPADSGSKELARARALLRERDAGGQRIAKLVEEHARALARLAERARATEPAVARSAVGALARLEPQHPALGPLQVALDLLEPGEALFTGRDAQGWRWLEPPGWRVQDGSIVGQAKDVYAVTRTVVAVSGDFDLRAEARVLEGGKGAVFFLQGGWNDFRDNVSVGFCQGHVLFMEGRAMGGTADPPRGTPRRVARTYDPEAWTLYELRFRTGEIAAYVGGERVGSIPRGPKGYAQGHVALSVLLSTVAFRRIELVRR